MRARLTEGAALEVAGYQLTSGLAAAIAALDLGELAGSCGRLLTWFEVGSGTDLSPASGRIIERLSANGINVSGRVVAGEPFWSIEEPAMMPSLWRETAAVLTGG